MKNTLLFKNPVKATLAFSLFIFHFSLAQAQLSGIYTIDATKAVSDTNFTSFSSAADSLKKNGVSGPVIFNMNGTYEGCLHLKKIKGASATNTITFFGGGLYNDWDSTSNSTYDAIFLDSAQWIIINSMTLYINSEGNRNPGSTIELGPYACNNTITNCTIMDDITLSQSQYIIYMHGFDTANTFSNDSIYYYNQNNESGCIHVTGPNNSIGNSFINNSITNSTGQGEWGIYISGQKRFSFIGNTVYDGGHISGPTFSDNSYITVSGNNFWSDAGNYAELSFNNCPGLDTNHFSMIFNNFMSYNDNGPAITLMPGPFTKFCFNNIYNYLQSYAYITINYFPEHDNYFLNNSIYLQGGGDMIMIDRSYSSKKSFHMDYNSYYSSFDSSFTINHYVYQSYIDSIFYNLSSWQLTTGLDKHSIWVDPYYNIQSQSFYGYTNYYCNSLYSNNPALSGKGIAIPGITTDIDGKTRLNPPTIGANELPKDTADAGVYSIDSPATNFCPGKYDIVVRIENYGIYNLTSCKIGWTVNGSTTNSYSWKGSLDPDSVSSEIKIGSYSFSNGAYTLKIFTSMPNGDTDEVKWNDTMVESITVNPLVLTFHNTIDSFCITSGLQPLNATPSGGYWTGTGMNGNYFDPIAAFKTGFGPYTETYKYTDPISGCSNSLAVTLYVADTPSVIFSVPDSGCVDSTVRFSATLSNVLKHAWVFGDGDTDTSLNATHKYTKAGTYTVKLDMVFPANCYDSGFYKTIYIDSACVTTTGLRTQILNSGISIYPNPTASILNIESTNTIRSITIYDATGRVVGVQNLEPMNLKFIDVSSLAAGIYLIKLGFDNGNYSAKFMKE